MTMTLFTQAIAILLGMSCMKFGLQHKDVVQYVKLLPDAHTLHGLTMTVGWNRIAFPDIKRFMPKMFCVEWFPIAIIIEYRWKSVNLLMKWGYWIKIWNYTMCFSVFVRTIYMYKMYLTFNICFTLNGFSFREIPNRISYQGKNYKNERILLTRPSILWCGVNLRNPRALALKKRPLIKFDFF